MDDDWYRAAKCGAQHRLPILVGNEPRMGGNTPMVFKDVQIYRTQKNIWIAYEGMRSPHQE